MTTFHELDESELIPQENIGALHDAIAKAKELIGHLESAIRESNLHNKYLKCESKKEKREANWGYLCDELSSAYQDAEELERALNGVV